MHQEKSFWVNPDLDKDTHEIYPNLQSASELADIDPCGIIYYSRNFFGVVWWENGIRRIRDLKNWTKSGKIPESLTEANYTQRSSPKSSGGDLIEQAFNRMSHYRFGG